MYKGIHHVQIQKIPSRRGGVPDNQNFKEPKAICYFPGGPLGKSQMAFGSPVPPPLDPHMYLQPCKYQFSISFQ